MIKFRLSEKSNKVQVFYKGKKKRKNGLFHVVETVNVKTSERLFQFRGVLTIS